MKPTIGRVVVYNTTEQERKMMRESATMNEATKLPAIVSMVFQDSGYENNECNMKVLVDGQCVDLWKTSVPQGDGEGQWNWPIIAK